MITWTEGHLLGVTCSILRMVYGGCDSYLGYTVRRGWRFSRSKRYESPSVFRYGDYFAVRGSLAWSPGDLLPIRVRPFLWKYWRCPETTPYLTLGESNTHMEGGDISCIYRHTAYIHLTEHPGPLASSFLDLRRRNHNVWVYVVEAP